MFWNNYGFKECVHRNAEERGEGSILGTRSEGEQTSSLRPLVLCAHKPIVNQINDKTRSFLSLTDLCIIYYSYWDSSEWKRPTQRPYNILMYHHFSFTSRTCVCITFSYIPPPSRLTGFPRWFFFTYTIHYSPKIHVRLRYLKILGWNLFVIWCSQFVNIN